MTHSDKILTQIKKIVLEQEPTAKIYLYGSRARGTAKIDSDWDLLILLDKNKINYNEEQKITSPLYDFELDSGEVISPMIYSKKDWFSKYPVTWFYQNVMKEGREL